MDAEIPSTIGDPSMGEATEKPSDVYDDRLARSVAAEAVESEQSKEHYKSAVEMDLVKEREERELLRKSNVYEDCLASSVESEKSMEHYKSAVEMDLVKEREERELLRKSNVYEDCLASSVESEKSMEHYKSAVEMDLVKEREERELLRKRWLEDEEKRRVEQAITHRESGRTNAEKEQMNMGGGGQQQKMAASQPANSRKRSCNPGPPDMFPDGPADWRQDIRMMGGLANRSMPPQGYGSQAAMQNGRCPPNVAQNGMQRVPQQAVFMCLPPELQHLIISKIPLEDRPKVSLLLPMTHQIFMKNKIVENVELGTMELEDGRNTLRLFFHVSKMVLELTVNDVPIIENDDVSCECCQCFELKEVIYPLKTIHDVHSLFHYLDFVSLNSVTIKGTPSGGLIGLIVGASSYRTILLDCDHLTVSLHPNPNRTEWDMPKWIQFLERSRPKSLTFTSEEEDDEGIVIPADFFNLDRVKNANLNFDNVKCILDEDQFTQLRGTKLNFGTSFLLSPNRYTSVVQMKIKQWLSDPKTSWEIRVGNKNGSIDEEIMEFLHSVAPSASIEIVRNFCFMMPSTAENEAISVFRACKNTGFVLTKQWLSTFNTDYGTWKAEVKKHRVLNRGL